MYSVHNHTALQSVRPWLLARPHHAVVVSVSHPRRAHHQVGQDPAVTGDATKATHGGGLGRLGVNSMAF